MYGNPKQGKAWLVSTMRAEDRDIVPLCHGQRKEWRQGTRRMHMVNCVERGVGTPNSQIGGKKSMLRSGRRRLG